MITQKKDTMRLLSLRKGTLKANPSCHKANFLGTASDQTQFPDLLVHEVACECSHLSSPLFTGKVSLSYRITKRHQRTSVGKGDDKAVFAAYLGNCRYKYSCLRSERRKIHICVSVDAPVSLFLATLAMQVRQNSNLRLPKRQVHELKNTREITILLHISF